MLAEELRTIHKNVHFKKKKEEYLCNLSHNIK